MFFKLLVGFFRRFHENSNYSKWVLNFSRIFLNIKAIKPQSFFDSLTGNFLGSHYVEGFRFRMFFFISIEAKP